jgi:hypothetical protein
MEPFIHERVCDGWGGRKTVRVESVRETD